MTRLATAEIGPRRDADTGGRQRHTGVSQGEQRGQHEAAAGGVARDHDRTWMRSVIVDQPAVRRDGVVDGRGKAMLRRAAVVRQECRAPGGPGDGGGQMAVRARRANHVTTAVKIEHEGGLRAGRAQPLPGDAAHHHVGDLEVGGERKRALRLVILGTKLVERQRGRRREPSEMLAYRLDTSGSHGLTR